MPFCSISKERERSRFYIVEEGEIKENKKKVFVWKKKILLIWPRIVA